MLEKILLKCAQDGVTLDVGTFKRLKKREQDSNDKRAKEESQHQQLYNGLLIHMSSL